MRAGLKSSLIMQQESSSSRAVSLASDWYFLGRVRTTEEELLAVYNPREEGPTDYELLLDEAMRGEPTLFARQDADEEAWSIVQPILDKPAPLQPYDPGSWGPRRADALTRGFGGWDAPKPQPDSSTAAE